jgi:hypothetical protein
MSHIATDALTWKKSSHSGADPNCVEVALTTKTVAVRDSKDPHGPTLTFPPTTFARFLTNLR